MNWKKMGAWLGDALDGYADNEYNHHQTEQRVGKKAAALGEWMQRNSVNAAYLLFFLCIVVLILLVLAVA